MGGSPGREVRRFRLAVFALAAVVVCAKLLYLERWLVDNDNYITLSTFFSAAGHDEYRNTARRFYAATLDQCPAGDQRCVAYAGALFGEQTYTRPITAFFGAWLANTRWLASASEFLEGISRVTVLHVGASTLLVLALLASFLAALPRQASTFVAATLAAFGVLAFWLPEQTAAGSLQPLLGVSQAGGLAALALALAAWGAARAMTHRRWSTSDALSANVVRFYWLGAVAILVLRAVAYRFPSVYYAAPILGSQVGLPILLLALAGIVFFVAAVWGATRAAAIPAGAAWIGLLLLFGLVSTGENFFSTVFHIAARGQVFLLTVPVFVYVALNPYGRLLWLLPGLALFSVAVAGLVFGCLVATETVASIRRRRVSVALVVSVVLLVLAVAHTVLTGGNPVIQGESASLRAVMARLDPNSFLPGLAVMAVLAVAARVAWRTPDPGGDLLLRAVVLATLLAGAGQLGYALGRAGFDIMDPVAYNYILLSYYLAPAVCAAGLFLVMLGLSARPATGDRTAGFALNGRAVALLAAAVAVLAAARGGTAVGRPADPLAAIGRGAALVATQRIPDSINPLVVEAATAGDRYVVGRYAGDVITMMAVLKMKCRAAAGLLDATNVSIVTSSRPSS